MAESSPARRSSVSPQRPARAWSSTSRDSSWGSRRNDLPWRVCIGGQRRLFPIEELEHVWVEKTKLTAGGKAAAVAVTVVAGLFVVILVATASSPPPAPPPTTGGSCPYVYSWDGTRYVLDAEPYGGAIARGFQRDDWSELSHLRAQHGEYRLLMTNEADETQHTDLAELLVVDHAEGLRIVADSTGTLRGLRHLAPPALARDSHGRDLTRWLASNDRRVWEPDAASAAGNTDRDEIVLEFPKPKDARRAWLVVNAASSLWGSIVVKRMVGLLGRDAAPWLDSLGRDPFRTAAVYSWVAREETFQLAVEVETAGRWKPAGALLGSGPAVSATQAIQVDLGSEPVDVARFRVRPPAGFWALNAFEIWYDNEAPVDVTRIRALDARTSGGLAVAGSIARYPTGTTTRCRRPGMRRNCASPRRPFQPAGPARSSFTPRVGTSCTCRPLGNRTSGRSTTCS